MEEILKEWLEKVKKKIDEDEKVKKDLEEFDGVFQLEITDDDSYHVAIKKSDVGELVKGGVDDPRLTVTTDTKTMKALMSGEMGAMKAFVLKKIKVKGSFEDIIRLRKFMKTD